MFRNEELRAQGELGLLGVNHDLSPDENRPRSFLRRNKYLLIRSAIMLAVGGGIAAFMFGRKSTPPPPQDDVNTDLTFFWGWPEGDGSYQLCLQNSGAANFIIQQNFSFFTWALIEQIKFAVYDFTLNSSEPNADGTYTYNAFVDHGETLPNDGQDYCFYQAIFNGSSIVGPLPYVKSMSWKDRILTIGNGVFTEVYKWYCQNDLINCFPPPPAIDVSITYQENNFGLTYNPMTKWYTQPAFNSSTLQFMLSDNDYFMFYWFDCLQDESPFIQRFLKTDVLLKISPTQYDEFAQLLVDAAFQTDTHLLIDISNPTFAPDFNASSIPEFFETLRERADQKFGPGKMKLELRLPGNTKKLNYLNQDAINRIAKVVTHVLIDTHIHSAKDSIADYQSPMALEPLHPNESKETIPESITYYQQFFTPKQMGVTVFADGQVMRLPASGLYDSLWVHRPQFVDYFCPNALPLANATCVNTTDNAYGQVARAPYCYTAAAPLVDPLFATYSDTESVSSLTQYVIQQGLTEINLDTLDDAPCDRPNLAETIFAELGRPISTASQNFFSFFRRKMNSAVDYLGKKSSPANSNHGISLEDVTQLPLGETLATPPPPPPSLTPLKLK